MRLTRTSGRSASTVALAALGAALVAATPRAGLAQQPASAGAPAADVSWTAPPECPSSADLQRRVAERLPADIAVRARGRVDKRGGRCHVALDVEAAAARGERSLDASSCEALATSVAVVIAMSAAPQGSRERETEAEAEPAPAPASASASASASAPASASASASASAPAPGGDAPAGGVREARARALVRAHVVTDSGLVPQAAFGGGIAAGMVLVRDLTVEAHASLFASTDGAIAGAPDRGATFSLFTGGARACWSLTRRYEIAPCAGFEIARIAGSGFGAAKTAEATSVTWGPEASLAARLPVAGPLALRLGFGAVFPISRQSFVIEAAGTVHRPSAVALRGWLGPEVLF